MEKTPNRKLDEKLRKHELPEKPDEKSAPTRREDPKPEPAPQPQQVGFHGSHDERTLSPEE